MKKRNLTCCYLILILLVAGLCGCAGGSRGRLIRIETPTEDELRQNWEEYTVYYRNRLALVYKFTNDQKIIFDQRWTEITTADMMGKSKIWDPTWVKKILGQNDEMFGYLVHRYADRTNVKIIDENTIELYYHYVRTEGGP